MYSEKNYSKVNERLSVSIAFFYEYYDYGIYSNKSAGVKSKALQMASKVESFIAFAFPVFKNRKISLGNPDFFGKFLALHLAFSQHDVNN